MIVKCALEEGQDRETVFDPMLGSAEALAMGCSCPVEQPEDRRRVILDSECLVHELVKVEPS